MRIAILTNEYPPNIYGGAGVHVEHLTRELARVETGQHTVQVLCFGDQSGREGNLVVQWVRPGPSHAFLLMEKTLRNQAGTPKTSLISGVSARRRPGRAANTVRPAH